MQDALHIPVALDRCIALLSPAIEARSNPVIVDATLGMGEIAVKADNSIV